MKGFSHTILYPMDGFSWKSPKRKMTFNPFSKQSTFGFSVYEMVVNGMEQQKKGRVYSIRFIRNLCVYVTDISDRIMITLLGFPFINISAFKFCSRRKLIGKSAFHFPFSIDVEIPIDRPFESHSFHFVHFFFLELIDYWVDGNLQLWIIHGCLTSTLGKTGKLMTQH